MHRRAQRRPPWTRAALAAVATVAAVCALVSCTAGLGTDITDDAVPGTGSAGAAEPGQHSALPEPCGAVDRGTVRRLLPGGEPEDYAGEPAVTYDTGRRVGCAWTVPTDAGSRRLTVDLLRVISYNPRVSDDDQADQDFRAHAEEAGVPLSDPGTAIAPDDGATTGVTTPPDAAESASGPRLLEGVGDVAYLNDRTTDTAASDRRQVSVAFRSANVIVTVDVTEVVSVAADVPDGATLREGVETVARQLADALDG